MSSRKYFNYWPDFTGAPRYLVEIFLACLWINLWKIAEAHSVRDLKFRVVANNRDLVVEIIFL